MTERAPDIAIIGMAGRFPKAADVDKLWTNLCDGVEGLTRFAEAELLDAGVDPSLLADPDYVPVGGALAGADLFAASFFGYTARESLLMDPQQRHLLECSWEALENAGYGKPPAATGVFAGVSVSTYLLNRLVHRPDLLDGFADIETTLGTDKDFAASRVAYKLDLTGPAVVVQSACSSSLVAVHLACRALAADDCELALAGGASIDVPQRGGYLYKPEGIYSSDGHCRPFDHRADGMVGGSGAAVVVLKCLDRALRDRDTIHAVILGSAVNNDGANKVGYSAPSVAAQAEVITQAQAAAGIDPESVGYVEAHGTGTALGDPIEVAALTQAFATTRRGYCALGAVKSNIGHLNAAAGISGLIKAALVVRTGKIPPSIHFEAPNPHIDLDNSPFYINTVLENWSNSGQPRRAGVSSFGMGGTNAHVVLEQAPPIPLAEPTVRPQILVVSAPTEAVLASSRARLAEALTETPDLELRDVAFTLQSGRRAFEKRAAVVCGSLDQGADRLRDSGEIIAASAREGSIETAFLLPGQGSQHPGMARRLYETQTAFRREIDRCSDLLSPLLSIDLRRLMFAADTQETTQRLRRTEIAQCALFTLQYSLSVLWRTVGVQPLALLGHSIGEYTAACIAGVFGLEDALALVATRGRLMQAQPPGDMLAVSLGEAAIADHLTDDLVVAAINEPGSVVVAGPQEAVAALEAGLAASGVAAQRLRTSHAFHSPMMRPAVDELCQTVAKMTLAAPTIPFVSNVSGTWITAAEATDPDYWSRHLVQPVRFADGLDTLFEHGVDVLLEVGPGTTLTSLARRHPRRDRVRRILASLPHATDPQGSDQSFLKAAATLWTIGSDLRWDGLPGGEPARRIPLPTHPFERRRFWVAASTSAATTAATPSRQRLAVEHWCNTPSWTRLPSLPPAPVPETPLVVFDLDGRTAETLRHGWSGAGEVVGVRAASSFGRPREDSFEIDPWRLDHYERLVDALERPAALTVLHRWAAGDKSARHEEWRQRGFDSLLLAARALAASGCRVDWLIATESIHDVIGTERIEPTQATVIGPCRVIPLEFEGHRCRNVDLERPASEEGFEQQVELLRRELAFPDRQQVVAYRAGRRWHPTYAPLALAEGAMAEPPAVLAPPVNCLVTGGLSGVGAALAGAMATSDRARLALLSRTPLPERQSWATVAASSPDSRLDRAIQTVLRLEAAGCQVLTLTADVADREALSDALDRLRHEFGGLDVIVHAAGLPGGGAIELKSVEQAHTVMAPKILGTQNLWDLTRNDDLRAFVLCSSLASEVGGFGQVDYCAANAFQDAFAAAHRDSGAVQVIDWDTWSETGMAFDTEVPAELAAERAEGLRFGLRRREGQELFRHILRSRENRVLVSTTPLGPRVEPAAAATEDRSAAERHASTPTEDSNDPRPDLSTDFAAPQAELEQHIAIIWQRLFGLERIGANDDFFELGGHSLMATQLLNRLRKTYPRATLSLATLFERPTISSLAAAIEESAAGQPDTARPETAQPGATLPSRAALAALSAEERTRLLHDYLAERLSAAAGDSPSADIAALAPQICWDVRRDLDLPVYPHELRHATSTGDLAAALSAIVAGEPSPLRPMTGVPMTGVPMTGAPMTGAPTTRPPTTLPRSDGDRHPVAAAATRNDPIIFLVSAPRSGSTLLRLMLAGHPALFCPPELALLAATGMRQWQEQQHGLFARDGLTRALMELRDLSELEARRQVTEMITADLAVQQVYQLLQTELGARLLLDKSPAYALDREILARGETLFERARYILLTRHPAAVIESLVAHRMEALLSPRPVDDPWSFAETVWRDCNRNLLELEANVGARSYRLRYEDLVRAPESALRSLTEFLDLSFEESLLDPYGGGRMIDGPGDPDIFQHDGIDAKLADAWRYARLPRALSEETLELAAHLGYETTLHGAATPPSVLADGDSSQAGDLLGRLDDLSDEEVSTALSALLDEEADA